jgi:hypothetical protein
MILTVEISYEDFLKIKDKGYSRKFIKMFTAKWLDIDVESITDIVWSYKRKYDVHLNGNLRELQDKYRHENLYEGRKLV